SEHLDGQVIQLGSVPRKQLPALYKAAGVFVFPSYLESFGHPLVEAMAAGLPIVAADTPVNREICGPAAVYAPAFDPEAWADQIRVLLESPERCQRLRAASQAQVERFSWQTHVRILLQAMEGILELRRHEKV
ncbi:MAG: glycosyltransferase, partial [Candidatus Omnitrophica bacterium]|nr:glycosyltransferase [Candidatus Omnitrophota bacterium]